MPHSTSILSSVISGLRPDVPHHPNLLARAAGPGRTRSVALQIIEAVLARPSHCTSIVRTQTRAARFLHSNERRLIGDGIADLFRLERLLQELFPHSPHTDNAAEYWSTWLILQGLQPESAQPTVPADVVARLANPRDADSPLDALALAASLPSPAAQELINHFGVETAIQVVLASNQRAPIGIRINQRQSTRQQVLQRLQSDGIHAQASSLADHGIIVTKRANLQGHRLYQRGVFDIQDEASQLIIHAIPSNCISVIDYCAGAGGKTLQLASTLPHHATIQACDVRKQALTELQKRVKRARLPRVTVHQLEPDREPTNMQSADCVLVDAPCTGSGVLRRHPHNRHNMAGDALHRIQHLQTQLLHRAATRVNPHGLLIYATCSLLPSENEQQVASFLCNHPEFTLEPIEDWWPAGSVTVGHRGFLRTDPFNHGTDGFFAARLRRTR